MKLSPDQLEFALSQYHDGTLPPLERDALDEVLASDASARELLAQYQRLDALVKTAPALPVVDWNALQSRISRSLADQDAPVQSYKIGTWVKRFSAVAVAAVIVLLVLPLMRNGERSRPSHPSIAIEISPPGG